MDMIRPGVATYGFHPSPDTVGEIDLRPMMSLHTSIAQIRTIAAGKSISYGRTYTTPEDKLVAVLPIGYADGLSRLLSNRVTFRICGKEAPVVGRICMDMCMVDISEIPGGQGRHDPRRSSATTRTERSCRASVLRICWARSTTKSSATSISACRGSIIRTASRSAFCSTSSEHCGASCIEWKESSASRIICAFAWENNSSQAM